MNTIVTGIEVDALTSLLLHSLLITTVLGLLIGSFLCFIFRLCIRLVNFPCKVKTSDGYIYRTNSGIYVKKELLHKTNSEFKSKKRDAWIKHHQRQIDFLLEE